MSDQGWNNPGGQPPDPNAGGGWNQPPAQQPPPPQGAPQQWGQQPPPPQQGQWGQQPPAGGSGIDPKLAGVLAYLFGWLSGLIIYLVNKDHFSRFHGAQSILLSIAAFVIFFGLAILSFLFTLVFDLFGVLFFFLNLALGFGLFVLAIYLMVSAYQGKKVVLPVIGPIAEQWAVK